MPKILISYRRSDSAGVTGRIFDRLVTNYGKDSVFMDVDNIPFGVDFRQHIRSALLEADVLLVVMANAWLGRSETGSNRIHDPTDPVRVEVEAALQAETPMIPILVDEARMPGVADLPPSLHDFAFRNAAKVDQGRDFGYHVDRLIRSIDGIIQSRDEAAATPLTAPPSSAVEAPAAVAETLAPERPAIVEGVAPVASIAPAGRRQKHGGSARCRPTRGRQVDGVVQALLPVSRVIDAINTWIGRQASWLILAAVMVSAVNAVIRKLFDASSNSWLELQWVLFGVVFLLCAPWTLMLNEHIRIDIVNSMMPQRVRNWIDVVGHAFFLLPLTIIMIITGLPFFTKSLFINEQSFSAGGLPQWPAKSLLLIGFSLLFLQGLSELIKRIAVMRGLIADPYTSVGGLHAAAEAEVQRLLAEEDVAKLLAETKPDPR